MIKITVEIDKEQEKIGEDIAGHLMSMLVCHCEIILEKEAEIIEIGGDERTITTKEVFKYVRS